MVSFAMKLPKVWTKEDIQKLLKTNPDAVDRAVKAIHKLQNGEEMLKGKSIEKNGQGFTRIDAEFFGRYHVDLVNGVTIDPARKAIARNKMPKYWRQLLRIANSRPF